MNLSPRLHLDVKASLSRQQTEKISSGDSGATLRMLMQKPTSTINGTDLGDGTYIDEDTGEIKSINTEAAKALNSNQWNKRTTAGLNAAFAGASTSGNTDLQLHGRLQIQQQQRLRLCPAVDIQHRGQHRQKQQGDAQNLAGHYVEQRELHQLRPDVPQETLSDVDPPPKVLIRGTFLEGLTLADQLSQ